MCFAEHPLCRHSDSASPRLRPCAVHQSRMCWPHKITRLSHAPPRHAVRLKRATPPVRTRSGSVGPHPETQVQGLECAHTDVSRAFVSQRYGQPRVSVSSLLRMTLGQTVFVAVDRTGHLTRCQWSCPRKCARLRPNALHQLSTLW